VTPIVDAFIAAYLIAAWCWRLRPGTIGHAIVAPAQPVLRWAGLEQIWAMFAPDPPQASHVLRAVITLRSGRAIVWEPPAVERLPPWNALLEFRYREFASTMLSEAAAPCRPALVEYLLRKYDFGGDPPAEVLLVCERAPVAGPGASDTPGAAETFVVHGHVVGGGGGA
jgi:hypothetical protein